MTDLEAVKRRQQEAWATGDFAKIAASQIIIGELLCEAVEVRPRQTVLDVATGSGNTALAAARRYAVVTGVDFVPSLLDRGRERAAVEGLRVTFREADAESLPFPDASFDVVLSTFGVIFAPDQDKAAAELLRVCRPGGKIGMANWVPESLTGEMFHIVGRYVPRPASLKPPTRWGTEEGLRELLGSGTASIRAPRRVATMRSPSLEQWVQGRRRYCGPTMKALESLDPAGQEALTGALRDLAQRFNRSGDDTFVAPSEYLEVVAVRK